MFNVRIAVSRPLDHPDRPQPSGSDVSYPKVFVGDKKQRAYRARASKELIVNAKAYCTMTTLGKDVAFF
jgi:hypothetical protein